jgi:hypothetical protein
MKYLINFNSYIVENANLIKTLQKELSKIENWFYNNGSGKANRTDAEWDTKSEEADNIKSGYFTNHSLKPSLDSISLTTSNISLVLKEAYSTIQ